VVIRTPAAEPEKVEVALENIRQEGHHGES